MTERQYPTSRSTWYPSAAPERGPIRVMVYIEHPPAIADEFPHVSDTSHMFRFQAVDPVDMVAQMQDLVNQLRTAWALDPDEEE